MSLSYKAVNWRRAITQHFRHAWNNGSLTNRPALKDNLSFKYQA